MVESDTQPWDRPAPERAGRLSVYGLLPQDFTDLGAPGRGEHIFGRLQRPWDYREGSPWLSKEIRALANSTASSLENIEFIVNEIQEKIRDVAVRTKDTSISMLSEKETLLSVAGALQGVLLAVEVIRTVSSVSSEKALELQKNAEKASKGLDVKDESVLIPMINSALEDLEGIMNDLSEQSDNR